MARGAGRTEALAEVRGVLRRRAAEAETRTAAAVSAAVEAAVAAAMQVVRILWYIGPR